VLDYSCFVLTFPEVFCADPLPPLPFYLILRAACADPCHPLPFPFLPLFLVGIVYPRAFSTGAGHNEVMVGRVASSWQSRQDFSAIRLHLLDYTAHESLGPHFACRVPSWQGTMGSEGLWIFDAINTKHFCKLVLGMDFLVHSLHRSKRLHGKSANVKRNRMGECRRPVVIESDWRPARRRGPVYVRETCIQIVLGYCSFPFWIRC
jgi:hypothetical protein